MPPFSDAPSRTLGLVLAGGRSSRMGRDKAWLELGGASLLDRVAQRLGAQCATVIVSANGATARFAASGLPVVADDLPGRPGPLAGILAGLDWAAAHRPELASLLSVAVDTPFLPRDLVARLSAAAEGRPACAASDGRRHPAVALWPLSARDDLRRLARAGEARMWAVLDGLGAVSVAWPAAPYDPFLNLNTPADVAAAESVLGAHPDA